MLLRTVIVTAACLPFFALGSCAATRLQESSPLAEAVSLQQVVLTSPHFSNILAGLEKQKAVDWNERFYRPEVRRDAEKHSTPMAWLLDRFAARGAYTPDQVTTWRKVNPFSSTVAVTTPLVERTKLNSWNLSRVPAALTNTLIHERVHSFGTQHPYKQTRLGNECDASYLAGDLAQAILAEDSGRARAPFDGPMCPALCAAIRRTGLNAATLIDGACPA